MSDEGPKRIAVVEDEGIVALDIKSELEQMGYEVVGLAGTGREAIELIERERPDLALLDINLRGDMDGIAVAEHVGNSLPVVFLSAYSDEATVVRATRAGPYGYVLKPFDERSLRVAVEVALYRHEMQGRVRAAEDALRRVNAELEERVARRTARLERANAELEQFVRLTSHDLQSPVRGMGLLAEFLADDLEGQLSPKHAEMLAIIAERAAHMQDMLRDLLRYSLADDLRGAVESVDTRGMVERLFRLLVHASSVQLELSPELPRVDTLRAPLEQVLLNLLDNAFKYGCPGGDGRIEVSVRRTPLAEGEALEFSIRDHGPGIDAETESRLFDIFGRGSAGRTGNGHGVGLPIVRRIVQRFGGTIRLEHPEGQGCDFRFTWPVQLHLGPDG